MSPSSQLLTRIKFTRQCHEQFAGKFWRKARIEHLTQYFRFDRLSARALTPGYARQMLLEHFPQ